MSFLQKNIQSVSCLQRYEDEEHMKLYEQCGFPSLKHLFAVESQTKYDLPLRVFRYFPSTEMTSPIPTTINPQMRLIRPPAAKLSSADSMSIGSTPKDSESPRTNPQRSKLPNFITLAGEPRALHLDHKNERRHTLDLRQGELMICKGRKGWTSAEVHESLCFWFHCLLFLFCFILLHCLSGAALRLTGVA